MQTPLVNPVIPVLDLLNGVVVHAVEGKRDRYQRLRSALVDSCDPSRVMRALMEYLRPQFIYVADLDGILYQKTNRCVLAELTRMDVRLIVDAGVCRVEDAEDLLNLGIDRIVLPTETLPDFAIIEQCVNELSLIHI